MRQLQKGDQEREQRSGRWTWLAYLLILHPVRKTDHRVPEETQASSATHDSVAAQWRCQYKTALMWFFFFLWASLE